MESLTTYLLRLNCAQAVTAAMCAPFVGQVSSKLDEPMTVVLLSILAQPAYLSSLYFMESFYLLKEIYLFTLALLVCTAAATTQATALNLLSLWANVAVVGVALYALEEEFINALVFWIICGATALGCSWVSTSARMFSLSVMSLYSFQSLLDEQNRQIPLDSPGHFLHFGLLVSVAASFLGTVDVSKAIARMLHAGIGSFVVMCIAYVLTRSWSAEQFKAKAESLQECQRLELQSSLDEVPVQCGAAVVAVYPLVSLLILPKDAGHRWFWLSLAVVVAAVCVLVNERQTTQTALFYTLSTAGPTFCLLHFVKQTRKAKGDASVGSGKEKEEGEVVTEPEEEASGDQESATTPDMKRAVLERAIQGTAETTERIRTELFQVQQRMFQLEAQSYGEVDREKKKDLVARLEDLKEVARKLEQQLEESSEAKQTAQEALDCVAGETQKPKGMS